MSTRKASSSYERSSVQVSTERHSCGRTVMKKFRDVPIRSLFTLCMYIYIHIYTYISFSLSLLFSLFHRVEFGFVSGCETEVLLGFQVFSLSVSSAYFRFRCYESFSLHLLCILSTVDSNLFVRMYYLNPLKFTGQYIDDLSEN